VLLRDGLACVWCLGEVGAHIGDVLGSLCWLNLLLY
jgi:hypothetical protein